MKVQKKFVRYISHELRTPLNAVRMGLQFLIAELPKFIQNHELMDSLETTELASLSAINILNDLLTFDKIEEGNLTLDRQMVSARDLISSATAIFHAQVRRWTHSLSYFHFSLSVTRNLSLHYFHFAVP